MALLRKSESAIVGEGGREGCRDAGMQTGRGWPCSLESRLMAMALPTRRRVTVAAGRRQRVRRHGADTAKSGCLPPRGTTERVELKVSRRARPKPCAAASGVRLPTQLGGGGGGGHSQGEVVHLTYNRRRGPHRPGHRSGVR